MALAAQETATWPGLDIKTKKLARGMAGAKLSLQLNEWAHEDLFVGAVLDYNTGAQLEYRDLIKIRNCVNNGSDPWQTSSDDCHRASAISRG